MSLPGNGSGWYTHVDFLMEEVVVIRFHFLPVVAVTFQGLALAQNLNFDALPKPPIPADPLEMVTGNAQPVQNAEERATATAWLTKARQLSNVRAQPYDLKTSFTSSGSLPSDGNWTLEDIAPGHGIYRWAAQGPGYSAVNLYTDTTRGPLYSNQAGGVIPLRLAQIRAAIFFNEPPMGPHVAMRTATGDLNGAALNCVLSAFDFSGQTFTGSRSWYEYEYCVDANTGLLTTYSPVPGLYVHYIYTNTAAFHGKTIPSSFTITEAGKTMIEAKTESVGDPPDSKSALFNSAGLTSLGVGVAAPAPVRSRRHVFRDSSLTSGTAKTNAVIQMVVVHGIVSPDGRVSETEILASTDSSLNETALERAKTANAFVNQAQPGVTPQSREIVITFEFAAAQSGS